MALFIGYYSHTSDTTSPASFINETNRSTEPRVGASLARTHRWRTYAPLALQTHLRRVTSAFYVLSTFSPLPVRVATLDDGSLDGLRGALLPPALTPRAP